ncbi:Alpha-2,8-Sialyltransferase 8F [Manis pentadactyla]|nr:Alpha-2,8-Sialyltransferase 8F [Manis pentadactyla]
MDGGKEAVRSPEKEGQQQNAETLEGVPSWRLRKEVTDAGARSFLVAPNGQNKDHGAVAHVTAEGLVADAIPTSSVYLSEKKTQLTIAFTGSRVYRNSMQTLV